MQSVPITTNVVSFNPAQAHGMPSTRCFSFNIAVSTSTMTNTTSDQDQIFPSISTVRARVRIMLFNATFNNISVISRRGKFENLKEIN
jgi:hypothetical protein